MIAGTARMSVIIKIPLAILSFRVFNANVNAAALASNAKLIIAVSNVLLCITTSKKSKNSAELAFQK